ncbi:universal stress protein, partial [Streptomyces tendae]
DVPPGDGGVLHLLLEQPHHGPDVPVVEHVEMGSAGQVLLSVSANAQLMVVGRRARRTAVGARIGSVAHGVLHHAECPVAVVPHT